MSELICPVCAGRLIKHDGAYRCGEGHSFDTARQGYVNLLRSQQSSKKHHGDDKLMVMARRKFLGRGYYAPLCEAITELAVKYCPDRAAVLDAGCGEGWYTKQIYDALSAAGKTADMTGIDISKDALKAAGAQCGDMTLAVASVYDMPVADGSQDMVMNIFAPLADAEYRRVLKKGGIFLRVVPDERHLFGLKEKIYDEPYLNDAPETELYGFDLIEDRKVGYTIHLGTTDEIVSLFMMTPYYYKTGKEDQNKVLKLTELDTEAEFRILVYRKK